MNKTKIILLRIIRQILFVAVGFVFASSISRGKYVIYNQLINIITGVIVFSIALSTFFLEFNIEKKSHHSEK